MSLLQVSSQVLVPAEPERVWQVAMDWSRQQDWIWGTQVNGGTGVGAKVVARRGELSQFRWTEQLELPLGSAGALGRWLVLPLGRAVVAPLARRGLDAS